MRLLALSTSTVLPYVLVLTATFVFLPSCRERKKTLDKKTMDPLLTCAPAPPKDPPVRPSSSSSYLWQVGSVGTSFLTHMGIGEVREMGLNGCRNNVF